jgi:predicted lipoprotein with Yx(FWY)xxD motif
MRIASHVGALALAVSVALLAAGAAIGMSHVARASMTVRTTALGKVLADQRGRTLYLFEKDKRGMSACSGSCVSFWPPLLTNGKPRVATGIKRSLLGTIRRSDGRTQVTYGGHPLYRFSLDTRAGQTKGEGLDDFGAHWYAVSPAGAKVVKKASTAGSGSGSGGGSGYPGYPPRR